MLPFLGFATVVSDSVALLQRKLFAALVWPWTLYHSGKEIDDEDFRGGWGASPHDALGCGEKFIGLARLDGTVLDSALSLLDAIGDAQAWPKFLG